MRLKNNVNLLCLILILFTMLFINCYGCMRFALKQDRFIPKPITVNMQHEEHVFVKVDAIGIVPQPREIFKRIPDTIEISEDIRGMYQIALVESLRTCKLYKIAVDKSSSDYELEVTILRLAGETNNFGESSGVILTKWCLKKHNDRAEILYQKEITSHVEGSYLDIPAKKTTLSGVLVPMNPGRGFQWFR